MHTARKGANKEHVYYGIAEIDPFTGQTSLRRGGRKTRTEADGSGRGQTGLIAGMRAERNTGFSPTGILQPLPNWYVPVDVRFGGGGWRGAVRALTLVQNYHRS